MRILLRDLTPGTNYTLQLRQNNGTEVSDWSRIFELLTTVDTLAPAQVENVTWVVNRTGFVGKWDATTLNADTSPCNDLSHYRVRIASPSSGTFDVNTTNNFFDFSFEQNKSLFGTPQSNLTITVFAVDIAGNASVASSTANAVNTAPPAPTNAAASGIVGGISILWDVQTIDDLAAYDVFASTSGPGFTPDSSNHVWSGTSNSYVHETNSLGVIHYFKIRSRDVYGSISSYVTVSATPISPTDVDTTPPGVPSGLGAVMTADPDDAAFAIATVTWSAILDADLAGYVVRYKPTSSTSYNFVNVPAGNTSVIIDALIIGIQYDFAIQAFDQLSNRSSWSSTVNATAANTAPSTPAAATAAADTQSVQVSHNLQKATSGRLEADVSYLQVHLGTSSGFTASDANMIGSMQVEPGSTFVSAVFTTPVVDSSVNRWVRVIAVDRGGLKSAQSVVSAVTIGLILNANIANATITSAKINDLEANKITAGTGIINNLLIKSSLTVDTAGVVKSSNYSAGVAGWQLTNNSLEINQGTIRAAALQLQDSANIIIPQYADYEFFTTFYTSNLATFNNGGTTSFAIATSPEVTPRIGTQVLKHTWSGGGGGTLSRIYNGANVTTYNIPVEANTDYIYSGYFLVLAGAGTKNVSLGIKTADAVITIVATTVPVTDTGQWQRVSGTFNTGANTSLETFTSLSNAGSVYVDSLQIERKITGATAPSPWRAPSYTRIDGGIIRTGSIQSTASADGLGGQPAWSINTTGGAQFGDATVRGRLVVGDPSNPSADGANSRILSANYATDTAGWIIRNDGFAEFTNAKFNFGTTGGKIIIEDGEIAVYQDPGSFLLATLGPNGGFGGFVGNGGLIVNSPDPFLPPAITSVQISNGMIAMYDSVNTPDIPVYFVGGYSGTDQSIATMSAGAQNGAVNIDTSISVYSGVPGDMGYGTGRFISFTAERLELNLGVRAYDLGRGYQSYAVVTSNSSTTTAELQVITSGSLDWFAGRVYRITFHFQGQSSVGGDQIGFRIRKTNTSGNSLYDSLRTFQTPAAAAIINGEGTQLVTPTSDVTTNVIGSIYRANGTGNVNSFANAANPVWLTVQDVGNVDDFTGVKVF